MVLFCRKCGNRIPSDSDFCPFCGNKVLTSVDIGHDVQAVDLLPKDTTDTYNSCVEQETATIQRIKKSFSERIRLILICVGCLLILGFTIYNNIFKINHIPNDSSFSLHIGDTVYVSKHGVKFDVLNSGPELSYGINYPLAVTAPYSRDSKGTVCVYDKSNEALGRIDSKYISEHYIFNTDSWHYANEYYGQEINIEGPVQSTAYKPFVNGSPTFINIGYDSYNSKQVTAIIWGKDRWKFPKDIEQYLDGKNVRIFGEVYEYEGHPNIRIKKPSQIYIDER